MDNANHYSSDGSRTIWAWLFPITYALHIAEEYWCDFPGYLLRTHGVQLTSIRFLVLQSLGLTLMFLGIVLSRRFYFPNQMLIIFAAVVIGNSCNHVVGSILYRGYEPGLVTSLLLWLPLGTITLFRLWGQVKPGRYLMGATIGIAICAAIQVITLI
jgi:Protein of unknown function with HXXEE motif